MINKVLHIFLFLFIIQLGYSQKITEKSWDSGEIQKLWIESNVVSMIRIISEDTTLISLTARMEGEYSEQVLVTTREENGTLSLQTDFTPFFKQPNDKLAAHKVFSVEFDLVIPKDLEVVISSEGASLETSGEIRSIKVVLAKGNCSFKDFLGNAEVFTEAGNIEVFAQDQVKGIAESQNGTVKNDLLSTAKYMVEARSVNGDIRLLKSQ
ncbi:MAG: hypothetical protein AAFP76_01800 [Bacteroidota bacterium]